MARPAKYDRNDVLQTLTRVFWKQGYAATPISTLVKETGLKPASLYAAFNSKHGLLLATLDAYGQMALENMKVLLGKPTSPRKGLRQLFNQIVMETAADTEHKGCYLINTLLELGGSDEEVTGMINDYLDQIEKLLKETLDRAQTQGEIAAEKDTAKLATFLLGVIWSLRVMSKTMPTRKRLQVIATQALEFVFND